MLAIYLAAFWVLAGSQSGRWIKLCIPNAAALLEGRTPTQVTYVQIQRVAAGKASRQRRSSLSSLTLGIEKSNDVAWHGSPFLRTLLEPRKHFPKITQLIAIQ